MNAVIPAKLMARGYRTSYRWWLTWNHDDQDGFAAVIPMRLKYGFNLYVKFTSYLFGSL